MTPYAAPLADFKFLLHRVLGLGDVLAGDGHGHTPEDIDAALEQAGRFAAEVLAPLNPVGDRQPARLDNGVVRTPPGFADAYRQFVEMGWNGVAADPAHGGQGLPAVVASALTELWNSANMSFSLCPLLTQPAIELLQRHGTAAQQATYLAPLVEGRWTGTMNLTEPQAGSDVGALRTRAVRENGHYRLTGQKIFITYGDHDFTENVIHLVLARLPDGPPGIKGISLFLVPKFRVGADGALKDRNDLRVVSLEHKLGIHGSPTAVLAFGDDGGAYAELIGEPHRGIEYMFTMMNLARLAVGVQGVAIAERAYQQAREYARGRVQGRALGSRDPEAVSIIRHPDVRRMLMLARVKTEAARALVLETAVALDRARLAQAGHRADEAALQARVDLLIPIAKAWSTDIGVEVASLGIQVHGGVGFIEETGAAQYYRDARIAPIYEGTNGIQAADLIGRKLMRDRGAAMHALIAEIAATAAQLAAQPGDDLAVMARGLEQGGTALAAATDWAIARDAAAPHDVAAVATPYLELAGIVIGGWLMARAQLAAQQALFAGQDPGFHEAKLIAGRCYAEQVLCHADGLARAVMAGGASILALDETQF
jgi:alkylation response protein AidB-like acyl-CoA dehydrogenase